MDLAASQSLSFIVTVALGDTGREGNDLERFSLLADTFIHFFDRGALGDFLVVARPQDIEALRHFLADRKMDSFARVVDENEIVPELASDPATSFHWPTPNKGWYRQQLIKLAAHRLMKTEFYMTLDSDIIFVKPFDSNMLIKNGRSIVNVQSGSDYAKLYTRSVARAETRIRLARYADAERVLGLTRTNSALFYGETPVVLSRSVVAAMSEHLAQRYKKSWHDALLSLLPWTEYPLYFTFAEAKGLLSQYHILGQFDSVLRMTDSLWHPPKHYKDKRCLDRWSVADPPRDPEEGIAIAVQSYLGYSGQAVRDKLGKLLDLPAQ